MAAMAGTLRLGSQDAGNGLSTAHEEFAVSSGAGVAAASDLDAMSPKAMSPVGSQEASKGGDRGRILRVEVNGLLHDWFNVEEMGDVLRSTSFASTLRENVARYFGVPLEKQAIYDEDGLLTTGVDFSRALQRVNPKLYVYDLSQMGTELRDRTCEELEKIEADVEQSWQHFGARSARSRASLPAEGMCAAPDSGTTRLLCKNAAAEDTLCGSSDESSSGGQQLRFDLDTTRREYEEIGDQPEYPPEVVPEVVQRVVPQAHAKATVLAHGLAVAGGSSTPVAPILGGPSPRCGSLLAVSAGGQQVQSALRGSIAGAVTSCSSTLPGVPLPGMQLAPGAMSVHTLGAPLSLPIGPKGAANSWVPLVAPTEPRRQETRHPWVWQPAGEGGYADGSGATVSPRLTRTPPNPSTVPPQTPPRWPSVSPHHGAIVQRTPGMAQATTPTPLSVRGNASSGAGPSASPMVPGMTRVESGAHPLRQSRASCSGHSCSGPLVTTSAGIRGNTTIGGIAGERSVSSARLTTPTPQQQRSTTPTKNTSHSVSQAAFQHGPPQQGTYVAPPGHVAGMVRVSGPTIPGTTTVPALAQLPAPGLLWQAGRSTTPRRMTQVPSCPATQPPGWPGAGFAATPQRSATPVALTPVARPASVTASGKRGVSRGRVEASKAPDAHVRALNFGDWSQQAPQQQCH